MHDQMDSTDTMTAFAVAEAPQPTARAVSPEKVDRPLRHTSRPANAPKRPLPPEDDDEPGFLRRFGIPMAIGAVVLGGLGYAFSGSSETKKAAAKPAPQQIVRIQPLPPPPPPPPKVQPPPPKVEDKKVEEVPAEKPEMKPEPAKPKPVDEPEALGTGLKGNGPGLSGLGSSGNGGGGNGSGGTRGDVFKWYAGQAVRPVSDALRAHPRTKTASMSVVAKIWVDDSARIERASLEGTTGDATLDTAIQNEVLPGVRLSEAPPVGMKMPIKLRLNARRQN